MLQKFTLLLVGVFAMIYVAVLVVRSLSPVDKEFAAACEGKRLTLEARNAAMEDGYSINRQYNCIDKKSFAEINRQSAAAQAARKTASLPSVRAESEQTLAEARQGFQTEISVRGTPLPLPNPPPSLFVRADYTNAGSSLPAFITPDPKDGQKHPAIIWLTGGDSSSLDDFWTPGPESDDQSASAFRKVGIIMMFPTLRGGNESNAGKEYFFGEVNDVLAAADHLARQAYVDASRIYLGGHSTGGTLALLTAETSGRFAAVFAFGPVATVDSYSQSSVVPIDFGRYDKLELKLRSPIHWLHGLVSPTYVIEGKNSPGNIAALEELCRSSNAALHCIPVAGFDHFSVLSKVSRIIAARLAINEKEFTLRADEF